MNEVFFFEKIQARKTRMTMERQPFEHVFPNKMVIFQCYVSFLGSKTLENWKGWLPPQNGVEMPGKIRKIPGLEIIIIFRLTVLLMEEILHHLGCM